MSGLSGFFFYKPIESMHVLNGQFIDIQFVELRLFNYERLWVETNIKLLMKLFQLLSNHRKIYFNRLKLPIDLILLYYTFEVLRNVVNCVQRKAPFSIARLALENQTLISISCKFTWIVGLFHFFDRKQYKL